MTDLFISYSRRDLEFVRRLHGALEARGRTSWGDWDIPAITEWMPEIEGAIDAADNALFVLSEDWLSSGICRREFEYAVAANKRLIPLRLGKFEDAQVPDVLAALNWIDFREREAFEGRVESLIQALDTDLDRKRSHTRLLQRARRWAEREEDASETLHGRALAEAENWLREDGDPPPTPLQTRFISVSRAAADRRRRRTWAAATLAIGVASVLGTAAWIQRGLAEERQQIATARRLAADSMLVHADDAFGMERKLLLAVESLRVRRTFEGFTAWAETARRLPKQPLILDHPGRVRRVGFSGDGRILASATGETVRLWEASTGELLLERKVGPSRGFAMGADGHWVAIPRLREVELWDLATGAKLQGVAARQGPGGVTAFALSPKRTHIAAAFAGDRAAVLRVGEEASVVDIEIDEDARIEAISFSPGSRRLALGFRNGPIHVYDLQSRTWIAHLDSDRSASHLAFHRDGTQLALSGSCRAGRECAGEVEIWNLESEQRLAVRRFASRLVGLRFSEHDSRLEAFGEGGLVVTWDDDDWTPRTFAPAGPHGPRKSVVALDARAERIATGGYRNTATVWDVEREAEIARLPHDENVTTVDLSPKGHVATGSLGGVVRVWDPPDRGAIHRLNHETNYSGQHVVDLDFSRDGALLATTGWDGTTRVWNPETGELISSHQTTHVPNVVRFAPGGDIVATAERCYSRDPCAAVNVILADPRTGEVFARLAHRSTVAAIAFSPDGERLVTGSEHGWIKAWNVRTGELEWSEKLAERDLRALAFTRDGETLLSAEGCPPYSVCEAALSTWDFKTKTVTAKLVHGDGIRALALSRDGRFALTTSSDLFVRLWDLASGVERWSHAYPSPLDRAVVSDDGKWAAVAGGGGIIGAGTGVLRVYDLLDGTEVSTIPHEQVVGALDLAADGRWVATASGAETRVGSDRGWRARVFDIDTGEEAARFDQRDALTDIAFSPDGRVLATAGWDQTVALYPWRTEDLIASACDRTQRNFRYDEWQAHFPSADYRCSCPERPIPRNELRKGERRFLRMIAPGADVDVAGDSEDAPLECPPPQP